MQEQDLINAIQTQDWSHIEKINDILASAIEPAGRFQLALAYLVDQFGYSQAALLIQDAGDDVPYLRVFTNPSNEMRNWFEDPRSHVSQVAQQVIQNQLVFPADTEINLAGAFPLIFADEVLGGLFVFGPELQKTELARWSLYTRSLSRSIHSWNLNRKNKSIEKDIQVLEFLLALQKENPQDANAIQHAVLGLARDIYQAQDAFLLLFEDGGTSVVFQKPLGVGNQWIERRSVVPDDAFDIEGLRNGLSKPGFSRPPSDFVRWLNLISDTLVTKTWCAALKAKNKLLGGLVVINSALREGEAPDVITHLLTSFLANAIETSRELTNLRVSVADLEANRWEIINSRNTLLTFFDSIPASVYIIDRNYTLISINLRRSGRLNKHPNVLVGKKCYEQLYNRMDPCPACRVMETFRSGAVTNRISREWVDQDRFTEWEITTFPIQESDHLPHRVIIFEEDVTEKRNLEANLIQSEKLASVGQLAAGVAHEINNPLAAIIANAQLIKRELPKDEDDIYSSVELIEMAGMRAAQVVSNLLSLARKEKKDEFELISLNETLLNALTLVNHEIKNHSIDIQLDLQENLPDIMASKNHLQGVWINMIVNSIDSMDQPNGKIAISTRFLNSEFKIILSDNGKGIPQEYLSRIFEPFFTTKVAGKGTGLGLSVCYRVVKEHQGQVSVESQPGMGTKFTIILPNLTRRN